MPYSRRCDPRLNVVAYVVDVGNPNNIGRHEAETDLPEKRNMVTICAGSGKRARLTDTLPAARPLV